MPFVVAIDIVTLQDAESCSRVAAGVFPHTYHLYINEIFKGDGVKVNHLPIHE
jgi:hypothetical protein